MGIEIYIPLYTQDGYYVDLEITDKLLERIKASVELLERDPLIHEKYIQIEGGDDEASD